MLAAFVARKSGFDSSPESGYDFSHEPEPAVKAELSELAMQMKTQLATMLPSYMIPAVFLPLTYMPLMASGKTDRRKLAAFGSSLSQVQLAHRARATTGSRDPSTGTPTTTDMELQRLWAKVLGRGLVADVGAGDNFFHWGGDSIQAMNLSRAARRHGFVLAVHHILAKPILSDMAKHMTPMAGSGSETDADADADTDTGAETKSPRPFALLRGNVGEETQARTAIAAALNLDSDAMEKLDDAYPCTPLQEGLMALSAKLPGSVVDSHAALRTRILEVHGFGIVQAILSHPIEWQIAQHVDSYLALDEQRPMGMGDALARHAIVHSNSHTAPSYYVLTIHHAIYDGLSLPILLQDLNHALRGAAIGPRPQFNSFIRYILASNREDAQQFWKSELSTPADSQLPEDALIKSFSAPRANFTTVALSLECSLSAESIHLRCHFDNAILTQPQVQRMVHQFEHLVLQLNRDPQSRLSDLDLISPQDMSDVLRWNESIPHVAQHCVHHLIEKQNVRQPSAPAVCSWDGDLTYAQLHHSSSKLAAHLLDIGIGTEDIVPICFEKSMWAIVAMLGIMKAGGAFVALDPDAPYSRLFMVTREVGARVMVCSKEQLRRFPDLVDRTVTIGPCFDTFVTNTPIQVPLPVALAVVAYPKTGVYSNKLVAIIEPSTSIHYTGTGIQPLSHKVLGEIGFDVSVISQRVVQTLPTHMVPAIWIIVEKMPTLPSTKIDRSLVNTWLANVPSDFQPAISSVPNVKPSLQEIPDTEEIAVAISNKIAASMNRGDRTSFQRRDFNIASVGIDSIEIISLVRFIEQSYKVKVSVAKILDKHTTIRSLATLIIENRD
ncbi:hypothetical protein HRS9139_01001 [Pyrenophora teres f. teres]|nr:hypothetical protein HRS9139_01001 [Pyrenophora teres f. teres]